MDNNHPYPMPLSKREQFIMAAMQGLAANAALAGYSGSQIASNAVVVADATLDLTSETAQKEEPAAEIHTMD